jgi:uncharacterized protein DUF2786
MYSIGPIRRSLVIADAPSGLLERVRKLLAKAEAEGVTVAEAEALTAKAAELMARYGIDRALLAAARPATDSPGDRMIDVPNPWAQVKAHLLGGLAGALRCSCVQLPRSRSDGGGGARIHIFGYASDLERTEILYTSLLIQMAHGLIAAPLPAGVRSVRAWRRSWLLGYVSAVVARVRAAEDRAAAAAGNEQAAGGKSAALVLADRSLVIRRQCQQAYPVTRTMRVTYTGSGYRDGYTEGQRADVGTTRLKGAAGALTR